MVAIPIKVEKLKRLRNVTSKEKILRFLSKHKGWAYTTKELAKKLKLKRATVRETLRRLIKNGKLEVKKYGNKNYYYAKKRKV